MLEQEEEEDDQAHIEYSLDILKRKRIRVKDLIYTQWIMNILYTEGI
jgi:hypothetical protein